MWYFCEKRGQGKGKGVLNTVLITVWFLLVLGFVQGGNVSRKKLDQRLGKIEENTGYYRILGVRRDCSAKEISNAYRNLAVAYHPDKNTFDSPEVAHSKFVQISNAYQILSNPLKRAEYDLKLLSGVEYYNPSAEDLSYNHNNENDNSGGEGREPFFYDFIDPYELHYSFFRQKSNNNGWGDGDFLSDDNIERGKFPGLKLLLSLIFGCGVGSMVYFFVMKRYLNDKDRLKECNKKSNKIKRKDFLHELPDESFDQHCQDLETYLKKKREPGSTESYSRIDFGELGVDLNERVKLQEEEDFSRHDFGELGLNPDEIISYYNFKKSQVNRSNPSLRSSYEHGRNPQEKDEFARILNEWSDDEKIDTYINRNRNRNKDRDKDKDIVKDKNNETEFEIESESESASEIDYKNNSDSNNNSDNNNNSDYNSNSSNNNDDNINNSDDSADEISSIFSCHYCRKNFKSLNQLKNHQKSKKHQLILRKQPKKLHDDIGVALNTVEKSKKKK